MLMGLLKKDLERFYYFEGQPDRKATSVAVWRRCLEPLFSAGGLMPLVACSLLSKTYCLGTHCITDKSSLF